MRICKDYIKQYTWNVLEDRDELWDKIAEEVIDSSIVYQSDPQHKAFNKMVENKLRVSCDAVYCFKTATPCDHFKC